MPRWHVSEWAESWCVSGMSKFIIGNDIEQSGGVSGYSPYPSDWVFTSALLSSGTRSRPSCAISPSSLHRSVPFPAAVDFALLVNLTTR